MFDEPQYFHGADGGIYLDLESLEQAGTTVVSGPGIGRRAPRQATTPTDPSGNAISGVVRWSSGLYVPIREGDRVRFRRHDGRPPIVDEVPASSGVSFAVTKVDDPSLFRYTDLRTRARRRKLGRLSSTVAKFRVINRDQFADSEEVEDYYVDERNQVFNAVPPGCTVVAPPEPERNQDGSEDNPVLRRTSLGLVPSLDDTGSRVHYSLWEDAPIHNYVLPPRVGITFDTFSEAQPPSGWERPSAVVRFMVREGKAVSAYYIDNRGVVYSEAPAGASVTAQPPATEPKPPTPGADQDSAVGQTEGVGGGGGGGGGGTAPEANTSDDPPPRDAPDVQPPGGGGAGDRDPPVDSSSSSSSSGPIGGRPGLLPAAAGLSASDLGQIILGAGRRRAELDRRAGRAPGGFEGIAASSSDAYRRLHRRRLRTTTAGGGAGGGGGTNVKSPSSNTQSAGTSAPQGSQQTIRQMMAMLKAGRK